MRDGYYRLHMVKVMTMVRLGYIKLYHVLFGFVRFNYSTLNLFTSTNIGRK